MAYTQNNTLEISTINKLHVSEENESIKKIFKPKKKMSNSNK